MNNKKSSTTSYLIIALVISGALLGYFYWTGNKSPEGLTMQEIDNADRAVGVRVLTLLGEISSLNIDSAFFSDPSYLTLRDYTVEIPPLPVGRSNPFSSVPGMSQPSAER